jgi:Ring finger domain
VGCIHRSIDCIYYIFDFFFFNGRIFRFVRKKIKNNEKMQQAPTTPTRLALQREYFDLVTPPSSGEQVSHIDISDDFSFSPPLPLRDNAASDVQVQWSPVERTKNSKRSSVSSDRQLPLREKRRKKRNPVKNSAFELDTEQDKDDAGNNVYDSEDDRDEVVGRPRKRLRNVSRRLATSESPAWLVPSSRVSERVNLSRMTSSATSPKRTVSSSHSSSLSPLAPRRFTPSNVITTPPKRAPASSLPSFVRRRQRSPPTRSLSACVPTNVRTLPKVSPPSPFSSHWQRRPPLPRDLAAPVPAVQRQTDVPLQDWSPTATTASTTTTTTALSRWPGRRRSSSPTSSSSAAASTDALPLSDAELARALQAEVDRDFALSLQHDEQDRAERESAVFRRRRQPGNEPINLSRSANALIRQRREERASNAMHYLGPQSLASFFAAAEEQALSPLHRHRHRRHGSEAPSESQTQVDLNSYESLLRLDESNGVVKHSGMSSAEMGNLPRIAFAPSSIDDEQSKSCSICLSDYEIGDTLIILPNCLHRGCERCFSKWLAEKSTCPLCRESAIPRSM